MYHLCKEPDARKTHVRICGGAGLARGLSTRPLFLVTGMFFFNFSCFYARIYTIVKDVVGSLDRMRKVEKLPSDNADVVSWFRQVYTDRLGFMERGEWEASRCDLKTDHMCEILYLIANDLTDLFRSVQGNLTEEDVMKVMGCEMSFQEGSMTRKDNVLMKLRDDEYEGKTISVESHLKLKSVKGEPPHQRLHFCYDPEQRKIIIGYLGDHLDSAATRYAKKRYGIRWQI